MRTPSTSAARVAPAAANAANKSRAQVSFIVDSFRSWLLAKERALEFFLRWIVPEPDAKQNAVVLLPGHRLALRHAVDEQSRGARRRGIVQHDPHALLRLPDVADHRE